MKSSTFNSFILLSITLLAIQACTTSDRKEETRKASNGKIPVNVMDIVLQPLSSTVQTSGVFTTDDETLLAFKTGGVIEKILVKEGDAIRKGQLLATLNLTEIDAQVAQARLALEKAKRDQQRVKNLYRDSVATLEQYQNVHTALEIAEQQYEAASFNRSHSEIHAVSNGFVLRKMASEGQVIAPGVPVLQTNSATQGNWKLRVAVSDREWAVISIDDKAVISTDAIPGKSLAATVTRKSEGSEMMGGAFNVELTLTDKDLKLASGLYGKASIETTRKQMAWKVPYEALLDGNGQTGYVFSVNDANQAVKTQVNILRIDRDHVLISSGLENARQIIISGSAYLKDGSPVEIRK